MITRSRGLTAVVTLMLLAAACSGNADSEPQEPSPAQEAPSTTAGGGAAVAEPVADVDEECLPDELCVTITATESIGKELRLMLYAATEDEWPHGFRSLPTPSWVISEYPAVPEAFPLRIRMPFPENLFAISTETVEGARMGLAIASGVDSIMTVESTDARGFSDGTLVFEPGAAMDFGTVEIALPAGDTCELNPYHPDCLTGDKFWATHLLGEEDFVPGAVYLDVADIDGDGVSDIVTVGEPHFSEPSLPLTTLKLGVYYMNADLTVREAEIIDQWSEDDPALYSPWGVHVIDHGGEPMILVGTNIPDLLPLEEGFGDVFSYRMADGDWVREVVRANPDPREENYNAMIVVVCDLDADGDEDLALSSAFGTSAVGSWMENTGERDPAWLPHLQTMAADTDPAIRGTLGYKCTDLNDDGYPEVAYNAMFDIPDTQPPRYRGEIWFGINPGPDGWDEPWQKVVVDDDNWASADMWFNDFDGDGHLDLVANQIFSSTVTRYRHPGADLTHVWEPEIIISGLTSPSDMWLTDMDGDGHIDVVSADHTAHEGEWHVNPNTSGAWAGGGSIFRNIGMPGDFAMVDLDEDGDLDWVGVSMTLGQAFIVEQTTPPSGLIVNVSLPDDFDQTVTRMVVTLANELPVTGIPAALLALVENEDADGDGALDVDQILSADQDLVLAIEDVGVTGDYHVVVGVYVEGGGQFQPVVGTDYLIGSEKVTFGNGPIEVDLELEIYNE
ncbi:MAG: VCBS repeat-containing protein [Acidimicrobiia bacterium]|nr:VCBS repeat-containing protein [Acidimicrobiia bacterium]